MHKYDDIGKITVAVTVNHTKQAEIMPNEHQPIF